MPLNWLTSSSYAVAVSWTVHGEHRSRRSQVGRRRWPRTLASYLGLTSINRHLPVSGTCSRLVDAVSVNTARLIRLFMPDSLKDIVSSTEGDDPDQDLHRSVPFPPIQRLIKIHVKTAVFCIGRTGCNETSSRLSMPLTADGQWHRTRNLLTIDSAQCEPVTSRSSWYYMS